MKQTILLCSFLAACASSGIETGSTTTNSYPTDYRRLAKDYVLANFKDPYSIRDAQIAPPKLAAGPVLLPSFSLVTPWVVCVRANAKNSFGAYAGASPTVLLIYNNRVETSHENNAWVITCADVKYEPFPEVMQAA
jgi:hypothetical protein